ncbi:MAG TPA: hypothetical protein VMY78_05405 [Solirubrobacteraceae bacterium]|nr:hypothetical protein [Solirubrobacteraceae bacterium]
MATLVTESGDLVLGLSRWERLFGFHGDIRVPLSAVEDVTVSHEPWREVRGLRAPGTGWPGRIALGTWRRRGGKDFVAIYRGNSAVIVRLRDGPFRRLLVSCDDADGVAASLR